MRTLGWISAVIVLLIGLAGYEEKQERYAARHCIAALVAADQALPWVCTTWRAMCLEQKHCDFETFWPPYAKAEIARSEAFRACIDRAVTRDRYAACWTGEPA